MAAAGGTEIEVLKPPKTGKCGEIEAVGPTAEEGIFIALSTTTGFWYLDQSGEAGSFSAAASFKGKAVGALGLHYKRGSADGDAFVSLVEDSRRSWSCLRVPPFSGGESGAEAEAEVVATTTFNADVAAVSQPAPEDPVVALALKSGAVRFMDLQTGKAAAKGLKFEGAAGENAATACARLGPGRAAIVRELEGAAYGAEFFVMAIEGTEEKKTVLVHSGTLGAAMAPLASPKPGPLAAAVGVGGQDRILLCWDLSNGKRPCSFASVVLRGEEPSLIPVKAAGTAAWLCTAGYLLEWTAAGSGLSMTVRDAQYGMAVASSDVPLAGAEPGPLAAAAGTTAVLIGGKKRASVASVRCNLPPFSLALVIGRGANGRAQSSTSAPKEASLGALGDVLAGKRQRSDPEVEELFSKKRHAATDAALAAELKRRSWQPSHELVDLIVLKGCWAAACALLTLPELDEDLSVRLLAGRPALLAPLVRRASAARLLEAALSDHLPSSALPGILEDCLLWLEAHKHFGEDALQKAAPGLPGLGETVRFLSSLADGCMPSLLRLDGDLLERVTEALSTAQKESGRTEKLHAALRVACAKPRQRKKLPKAPEPAIEAVLFDF